MKEICHISLTHGAGGFLNPPTHPEHTASVSSSTMGMSLSHAVSCDYIPDEIRARARQILGNWVRPALNSPEIQEWILQVFGYFKGCFKGSAGPKEWHVEQLRIEPTTPEKELLNADLHAGVHFIRGFYPEFMPTLAQFAGAYWGQKTIAKKV